MVVDFGRRKMSLGRRKNVDRILLSGPPEYLKYLGHEEAIKPLRRRRSSATSALGFRPWRVSRPF
jgi:hypothetical protein